MVLPAHGATEAGAGFLEAMPTDADIGLLYRTYSAGPKREDGGPEWGDGAVWEELRRKDSYSFWLD